MIIQTSYTYVQRQTDNKIVFSVSLWLYSKKGSKDFETLETFDVQTLPENNGFKNTIIANQYIVLTSPIQYHI